MTRRPRIAAAAVVAAAAALTATACSSSSTTKTTAGPPPATTAAGAATPSAATTQPKAPASASSAGGAPGAVAMGATQHFTDAATGTVIDWSVSSYAARRAGANAELAPPDDRIATISVTACLKVSSYGEIGLSWAHWTLVFKDLGGIPPAHAYSPRDFPKALFPNDDSVPALQLGQCRTGLVPFDVPAGETGAPIRIEYTSGTTALDWTN